MSIAPRIRSRVFAGVALALTALALPAGDGALAEENGPIEITVEARKGFTFHPKQIEVPAGREVVLTLENTGAMGHNLSIPELEVMTETITAGETDTVRFTPTGTGTYEFRCEVPGHAAAGMVGEIKVQ